MTHELTPTSPAEPGRGGGIDLSRLGWGLALIVIGSLFLIDRVFRIDFEGIWRFFPLIPAIFGVLGLAVARTPEKRRSSIWLIAIASWLLINTLNLYGFDWHNSWPLVIIMAGIIDFIQPKPGEHRLEGFWPLMIGLWLLVNVLRIGGLNWATSWPVLLVIVGLAIVFKTLSVQIGWGRKGGGSDAP